jgi:hypothetical protein
MMALKESFCPEKLSTGIYTFFIAEAEQVTPHPTLSPSKKGFNKVNAKRFSCLGLVSGRCSQDSDRKLMVRLIAARLRARANWLVFRSAPNPALALRDDGLTAGANFYLITENSN